MGSSKVRPRKEALDSGEKEVAQCFEAPFAPTWKTIACNRVVCTWSTMFIMYNICLSEFSPTHTNSNVRYPHQVLKAGFMQWRCCEVKLKVEPYAQGGLHNTGAVLRVEVEYEVTIKR